MWKRKRTWLLLLALVAAAFAAYFEPTRCVRGWLHGEAFFDGRPTSWWRGVVLDDLDASPPPLWRRAVDWIGIKRKSDFSLELVRSLKSDDVLNELAVDKQDRVARFARYFLEFHADGTKAGNDFECRVEWQFFLAMVRLNARKRFD